jgi:hypothetical protein
MSAEPDMLGAHIAYMGAAALAPERIMEPKTLDDVLHNAKRAATIANAAQKHGAERIRANPSIAEWLILVRAIENLQRVHGVV